MEEVERERWRGRVDTKIEEHDTRLNAVQARADIFDAVQRALEIKVNTIATKIGLFSALGAFVGGGIVSVFIGIFFRH